MGNVAYFRDIGNHVKNVVCGVTSAVAAGTGDNTAVTGATIDRLGFESCKIVVGYKTTLASSETLALAIEYQESDDGSSWDTAVALQASTTEATGEVTNSLGQQTYDLDLVGKKRYIRFNFTPNLSASGTDTALVYADCVLGGAIETPNADT